MQSPGGRPLLLGPRAWLTLGAEREPRAHEQGLPKGSLPRGLRVAFLGPGPALPHLPGPRLAAELTGSAPALALLRPPSSQRLFPKVRAATHAKLHSDAGRQSALHLSFLLSKYPRCMQNLRVTAHWNLFIASRKPPSAPPPRLGPEEGKPPWNPFALRPAAAPSRLLLRGEG